MSRPSALPAAADCDAKQRAEPSLDSSPSKVHTEPVGSSAVAAQSPDSPVRPALPVSVAQRCHTDALHCIFAFLSLKELLPALHSCRGWLAAGCKEPSRALRICPTAASIGALCTSPLRHHIAHAAFANDSPIRLDQLQSMRSLPRLKTLEATLDGADLQEQLQSADKSREQQVQLLRDAFPPQLRSLAVDTAASQPIRQLLMDALPELSAFRTVHLRMHTADLDLSPLTQLPQLSHLRFAQHPTLGQCAVVKQLAGLVTLESSDRNRWEPDAVLELLRPPHSLQQLQELTSNFRLPDPMLIDLLAQLPALTALRPRRMDPACWGALRHVTQLRVLDFMCMRLTEADLSSLASSLSALPSLSDLALDLVGDMVLLSAPVLALRCPALRRLSLAHVRVPSLDFLRHSPLLEHLHFRMCFRMNADDMVESLRGHAPPRLRTLAMHLCSGLRFNDEQRAALSPPSALLPCLVEFDYRDRVADLRRILPNGSIQRLRPLNG